MGRSLRGEWGKHDCLEGAGGPERIAKCEKIAKWCLPAVTVQFALIGIVGCESKGGTQVLQITSRKFSSLSQQTHEAVSAGGIKREAGGSGKKLTPFRPWFSPRLIVKSSQLCRKYFTQLWTKTWFLILSKQNEPDDKNLYYLMYWCSFTLVVLLGKGWKKIQSLSSVSPHQMCVQSIFQLAKN